MFEVIYQSPGPRFAGDDARFIQHPRVFADLRLADPEGLGDVSDRLRSGGICCLPRGRNLLAKFGYSVA